MALENARLDVAAARIHAILGENGAGKSTLIKILSGVVQPDAGRIKLDGAEVAFESPAAANAAGVVCIFQELSLVHMVQMPDAGRQIIYGAVIIAMLLLYGRERAAR
jgi:ribose transport system ATP-binding protein